MPFSLLFRLKPFDEVCSELVELLRINFRECGNDSESNVNNELLLNT